jgi:hypothetical protein
VSNASRTPTSTDPVIAIPAAIGFEMNTPKQGGSTVPLATAIAGILSRFIGATILVIYRSTMQQASEFIAILERINTFGMALHVLDTIPEGIERASMAALLLSQPNPSKQNTR